LSWLKPMQSDTDPDDQIATLQGGIHGATLDACDADLVESDLCQKGSFG